MTNNRRAKALSVNKHILLSGQIFASGANVLLRLQLWERDSKFKGVRKSLTKSAELKDILDYPP